MTDPKPDPKYSQFMRKITVQDNARDVGESPIHVGAVMLFDGVAYPGVADLSFEWEATGSFREGTVLSFVVATEQAKIGRVIDAGTGKFEPYEIAGIPVMVPRGSEWEPVEGSPEWLQVHVFVREFEFVAARPKAGDRVEDGGIKGTLVRCEKCSGDGLLHKPDELPATQEPQGVAGA